MSSISRGVVALICLSLAAVPIRAANEIDFERTEAWAMKYFSSVAAMSGYGVTQRSTPGTVSVGFEAGWVPSLSRAERTVGQDGTKVEDLNKTPAFGRLRVAFGLPLGLTASVGYVPPAEIGGARPNLLSADLARPVWEGARTRLGLRLHALGGEVEGDFTCDADTVAAGDDPVANPFACEEVSRDRVRMATVGLEAGIAFQPRGAEGPDLYATASVNRLEPRFQVHAEHSGFSDRTRLETSGTTGLFTAGVRAPVGQRWDWAAEAVYAPLTVRRPPERDEENDGLLTARVLLRLRVR